MLDAVVLDDDLIEKPNELLGETEYIISLEKFIFFSVLTFGLYRIWWMYKTWRFLDVKNNLDINPIARSIFSLIFFPSYLNAIKKYAQQQLVEYNYNTMLLYFLYLILSISGRLPLPYSLFVFLSFICFIQPFNVLNNAMLNDTEINVIEQNHLTKKQILLIVIGSMFWILVLIGFGVEE